MAGQINDPALENALARREHLRQRYFETVNEIERLSELRQGYAGEFQKVDAFIRTWYEMAGIPNPELQEQKESQAAQEQAALPEKRPQNPNRRDVTLKAVEYIREAERPLSRSEIWEKLKADDIIIYGKNPEMVLSTMLWRTKDLIRRLRGGGYWPVGDPPPPGHSTDIEDLIG
jgi:hypothetical protein